VTTPTYLNSVGRLIQEAYTEAGLVAAGQQLNSFQYANGLNRLTTLVNFQQTRGLKLFTNADVVLTLTAGSYAYTLGPAAVAGAGIAMVKPLRVLLAYYLDASGNVVPMFPVSWQEWVSLQKANNTGTPLNFFVDKQSLALNVNLWPVPDANAALGSVHLVLQQQIAQAVSLTDTISFPPEWYLGLMWGLAFEIGTGQPQEIIAKCMAQKKTYLDELENWDVEDGPVYFIADSRLSSNNGFV
jgi:hypothetical protein